MKRNITGNRLGWKEFLLSLFFIVVVWIAGDFANLNLFRGNTRQTQIVRESNGNIQVAFTSPRYPDDWSYHHDGLDAWLADTVAGAEHSVDVAAYDFDLQTVADALIRAQQRGVTVRLLTDGDNSALEQVQQLRDAGIPVVADTDEPFMHDKFVVIDGAQVWTGSWNLTDNGTYRNNNNVVVIGSQALAENYTAEFEEMFVDGHFGVASPNDAPPNPQVEVSGVLLENYFAPEDDVAGRILELLGEAQQRIDFMAFAFTDNDIGQLLVDKARAGVAVRGVMEERNITATGSDFEALRQGGVELRVDGNPYMMHHKVIIIDGAIVITGSYNFTASAAGSNDENVLIIHSPEIATQYLEEFQRVYAQAKEAQ